MLRRIVTRVKEFDLITTFTAEFETYVLTVDFRAQRQFNQKTFSCDIIDTLQPEYSIYLMACVEKGYERDDRNSYVRRSVMQKALLVFSATFLFILRIR